MARAASKPPTLLEAATSTSIRKRHRNWVDKIPDPSARAEICELLVAKHDGRIAHSANELAKLICAKFGNVCNRQSVEHWIGNYQFDRSMADVG